MASTTRESVKSTFKTPQTKSFKLKVKRAAYRFGTFMHWVFFKPTTGEEQMDPAQTSFAPVLPEDAGASAADTQQDSSMRGRTMAGSRDMVERGGPSREQVANHMDPHELHQDRPQVLP